MRSKKRKGTGRACTNSHTQQYSNKIENACLLVFTAFLGTFIGGYAFRNEPMTYLGLGLGVASLVIQTVINTQED